MKKIILFLIYTSVLSGLACHPHVFMDMKSEVIFDKQGLEGFNVRWKFDDLFSSGVILSYDSDHSGSFDRKEIKRVENEYFKNLANFNYFISYKLNGIEKR